MLDKYTPFKQPRQRVLMAHRGVVERGQVFLPAATWDALKRIGSASGRNISQVIESLVAIADKVQGGNRE